MTSLGQGVWIAAALAALIVLWAVGSLRRIRRLRRRAHAAFAALDAILTEQHRWVHVTAHRLPGTAATPQMYGWRQRLRASGEQAACVQQQLQRQPLDAAAMASLHQARLVLHAVLAAGAEHVAAADDAAAVPPSWPPEPWTKLAHQELPLATAFNEALASYNAAVSQFPTWLVAAPLRYRRARAFVPYEHV